jgi:hypothetical protein
VNIRVNTISFLSKIKVNSVTISRVYFYGYLSMVLKS